MSSEREEDEEGKRQSSRGERSAYDHRLPNY